MFSIQQYLILCYGVKIAQERKKENEEERWRRRKRMGRRRRRRKKKGEEGFTFHLSIPDSLFHDLSSHKTLKLILSFWFPKPQNLETKNMEANVHRHPLFVAGYK